MEKREKILLGVMIIALLFIGPYYFFSGDGKVPTVADLVNKEALDKTIKEVDEISQKSVLSQLEILRLQEAESPWVFNPFYDRSKDVKAAQEVVLHLPAGVVISYTGYVSVGGAMYAIINGLEYQIGNHLEIAGAEDFIVTTIKKNKIIIGKTKSDGSMVGELEIGIYDDESF